MTEWQWEPLDWQLGELLAELEKADAALLKQSVRLLSHQMRAGDTCLYLPDFCGAILDDGVIPAQASSWSALLTVYNSVGEEHKPLVLDQSEDGAARLYFQRYWQYEQKLASNLLNLARQRPATPEQTWLSEQLNKLPLAERQADAVERAFSLGLCVISGGPGTGKTTTISALIHVLKSWQPELKIAMAAPTGKAAARMQESVQGSAEFLGLDNERQSVLNIESSTLHRLLGYRHGKAGFRHNADNPLLADVVIVDEASMIDLALMSKLLEAVRPDARLILLGDKDQLASVEAGEVMATICSDSHDNPLRANVVELDQVHRYSPETGVHALAGAVHSGNSDHALDILASSESPDVQLLNPGSDDWRILLRKKIMARMARIKPESLNQFQVLCALRNGPRGVSGLNRWIENQLLKEGKIAPRATWYPGRPVIITRNNPGLKLYNGDLGLAVSESGQLRVGFPGQNDIRHFATAQLPQHETAWALTVHKSQGSEFDEIMLILPDESSPVLTRELVYTAITRARTRLTIVGEPAVLHQAIEQLTRRHSGLATRLKVHQSKAG